jgi:gentisate 1,2-dioxygenase
VTAGGVKTRAEFDDEIDRLHLRGQWKFDEAIQGLAHAPPPNGVPYLWSWPTIESTLLEACRVMPDSFIQRRNVGFMNPGLREPHVTNTLAAGVQIATPGEIAWGHRHSMGAIRFGIAGAEGLYTVVDGDVLRLLPNDLVLTPAWSWHDHHNESGRNGIWLDVLDVPLVLALGQAQFQPYGESVQPRRERRADEANAGPALRYAWTDIEPVLRGHGATPASPYDDVLLEYVNPVTGGPTLPTFACSIGMLRAGFDGATHRHASAAIYHVVEGRGVTVCDGVELHWGPHDSFVVPSWAPHRHVNASADDAILFSATDRPLLAALGLYREEPALRREGNS